MGPNDQQASGYSSLFTISFTALLVGQIVSILGDRLNNIALIEMLSIETGRFATPGSTFELSKLALAMTVPAIVCRWISPDSTKPWFTSGWTGWKNMQPGMLTGSYNAGHPAQYHPFAICLNKALQIKRRRQ